MSVVIWHNPKCTTSGRVLEMIRATGIEPRVVEYVKTPPTAAEIKAALKEMGLSPRELLRRRGTPYDELGLDDPGKTDAELIAAMAEHPILIERPIMVRGARAVVGRPPETVQEIL